MTTRAELRERGFTTKGDSQSRLRKDIPSPSRLHHRSLRALLPPPAASNLKEEVQVLRETVISLATELSEVLNEIGAYINRDGLVEAVSPTLLRYFDIRYSQSVAFGPPIEVTIANGEITVAQSYHTVDTQGDAGTDDLDTINKGRDGQLVILTAANDARTVVVKHGTGNIDLDGGTDVTLDDSEDKVLLIFDEGSSKWCAVPNS
jgi:hypothetical protein